MSWCRSFLCPRPEVRRVRRVRGELLGDLTDEELGVGAGVALGLPAEAAEADGGAKGREVRVARAPIRAARTPSLPRWLMSLANGVE